MKVIQKYQADDGKIFSTIEECEKYEQLCSRVEEIMKWLNPLPKDKGCRFANGGGYIQQEKKIVDKARIEIVDLGNKFFKQPVKWDFYAIGRLFNDSGYSCLYSAWGRLSNIDSNYREWGQGYYAIFPEKGIQKPYKE